MEAKLHPCQKCKVNKIPATRRLCASCRKHSNASRTCATRAADVLGRDFVTGQGRNTRKFFTTAEVQARVIRTLKINVRSDKQASALFQVSDEMATRLNALFA